MYMLMFQELELHPLFQVELTYKRALKYNTNYATKWSK